MRLLCALFGAACLASAVAMIYVHHQQRKYYVELTRQERIRDALAVEYGRLQLEQATWAHSARVEQIAQRALHMGPPQTIDIVVTPP